MPNDDMPTDLMPVAKFLSTYPDLFETEDSFRWYLRDRATNGLIESGAVVEMWNNPEATRPSIRISPSRFFTWIRKGKAA